MQFLRIADGQKWLLLSLYGMWQHKRLLVAQNAIKVRRRFKRSVEISPDW